jgi:hypothetical protein
MGEKFCGVEHRSISFKLGSINISEALDCVDKHNHSGHEFGSISKAVNLWWGERLSRPGKIDTLGYVIGLRNLEAGIAWRLDYDEKKGAHINQLTRVAGQRRWENLVHPIRFPGSPESFVKWFWRRYTEENVHTVPAHILERVKQLRPSHEVWRTLRVPARC